MCSGVLCVHDDGSSGFVGGRVVVEQLAAGWYRR